MNNTLSSMTRPFKPVSVLGEAAGNPESASARQPQVSTAHTSAERARDTGRFIIGAGAGVNRPRRSTDAAAPSTSNAGGGSASTRTRETSLATERSQLNDDEQEMKTLALRIPQPSEIVDRTVSRFFQQQPEYAKLETVLGADWPSRLQIYHRHHTPPEGDTAGAHEVPLREMSWRPRTAGGVTTPALTPDQFDIIHFDLQAGVTTVLPELNTTEEKLRLLRDFIPQLKSNFKAEQTAYWSTPMGDSTPARDMRRTLKSALRTETAIRSQTKTLSPEATEVVRAVINGQVNPSPSAAPGSTGSAGTSSAEVRRLTWKGEPVAGAFVFTPHAPGEQAGPAVLWRPGRPLQEFPDVDELRTWVAGENAVPVNGRVRANPDDAGTAPADGEVFALRLKDLRQEIKAGFAAALKSDGQGISLTDRLDNGFDPVAYLDLGRVRDGEWTEGVRQRASGENAPRETLELEALRQAGMKSERRLNAETATIPSFDSFTRQKLQEQFAQDHPELATIDPDKTRVHTSVVRHTVGVGGMIGKDEVLSRRTYSLTEYAQRNTHEWNAPHVQGQAMSPVVSTTKERVSVTFVDSTGARIRDQNADPVRLNNTTLNQLVTKLDVGRQYTELLSERLAPVPVSEPARRVKDAWIDATRSRMRAERSETALDPEARSKLTTETRGKPEHPRALDYIDAVIEYPDPASRPLVDKHTIVANRLTLGAVTEGGGGGQMINGVTVIGTASPKASPNVVLHTPDAPDGFSWRELSDVGKIHALLAKPEWKDYFAQRMATADSTEARRILDPHGASAGRTVLTPMQGNFYDEAYKGASGFLIAHAKHRSVTSSQVANRSTLNLALFALDTASSLAPFPGGKSFRRPVGGGLTSPRLPASSGNRASPVATNSNWRGWSNKDPELPGRLVDGNMGPGGVKYKRDPTTNKEYLNIQGNYYRGEYRRGQHVVFNDRNYSQSREVLSTQGALVVRSNQGRLRGGSKVPEEIETRMKAMDDFNDTTQAFRSSYYARIKQSTPTDAAVNKLLKDIGQSGGSKNRLYTQKHEDALRYAREAGPTAGPSQAAGPSASGSGARKRPTSLPEGADSAPGAAKRPRPAPASPVRVEMTGSDLQELSRRPVYRYLQSEKLGRERADRFTEFSSRDLGGAVNKRKSIIYFTDITPEQMEKNPELSIRIFGRKRNGQLRMNKIEAVQDIDLKHLPAGTKIYREAPHIYTIDRASMPNKHESGLQFRSVGEGSWMSRFRQKLNGSSTYSDVTVSSAPQPNRTAS